MEFWGTEVKPGQAVKYRPEDGHFLHLSQGALAESKKETDKATMYVKVGEQKFSMGTLSTDKFPQIQFDLVFDKEFELSHTSKTATISFTGYKVVQPVEDEEGEEMDFDSEGSEDELEDEKILPATKENGKAEGKYKEQKVKIHAAASKPKAVAKDLGKNKEDIDGSNDSESDKTGSDSDDGLAPVEDDSDESSEEDDTSSEDDESDDDEEETPKKPETGKKRAAENVLKTPASDKKAKSATSAQKTGDKKGAVHVATPHPAKKAAGKTPATNEKSPKSGGSVACKSCSKTFNSEMALQSHSKAKHESK